MKFSKVSRVQNVGRYDFSIIYAVENTQQPTHFDVSVSLDNMYAAFFHKCRKCRFYKYDVKRAQGQQ